MFNIFTHICMYISRKKNIHTYYLFQFKYLIFTISVVTAGPKATLMVKLVNKQTQNTLYNFGSL